MRALMVDIMLAQLFNRTSRLAERITGEPSALEQTKADLRALVQKAIPGIDPAYGDVLTQEVDEQIERIVQLLV